MDTYIILLRGINVGGKNKVSMAELKVGLEELGFTNVKTYINSGNVILDSKLSKKTIAKKIETILPQKFKLDSKLIRVLVLKADELEEIISNAPKKFGTDPKKYYSDVIFIIDKTVKEVFSETETHPEVDKVWKGKEVLYFQRLGSQRTKSRLGRIIAKPIYKYLTIRSWNTATKLLDIIQSRKNN